MTHLVISTIDFKVFETLAKDIDCTEHEKLIDNFALTLEEHVSVDILMIFG